MPTSRRLQEVSVKPLGRQTRADRFRVQFPGNNEGQVPRITQWGMNLTALSRYANLYFVAYGGQIHVYRPLGPHQILNHAPEIILTPAQSEEAQLVQYRFNHLHGHNVNHYINHLTIGDLGSQEIVLCSFDDGDAVAYYTRAVENSIIHGSAAVPFFHENVGISAWGLSIHQKSRLIAVSSNYHEVDVFAFALSNSDAAEDSEEKIVTQEQAIKLEQARIVRAFPKTPQTPLFPRVNHSQLRWIGNGKPMRDRNFRLILTLKAVGDNIPAISFSSDVQGDAETLVASDIRGGLWLFSLWKDTWKRLPTVPQDVNSRMEPLGWSVLVLPQSFYKATSTCCSTYGCSENWALRKKGEIDITETTAHVRDMSIYHSLVLNHLEYVQHETQELLQEQRIGLQLFQRGPKSNMAPEGIIRENTDHVSHEMVDMNTGVPASPVLDPTLTRSQQILERVSRVPTRYPMSLVGIGLTTTMLTHDRSMSDFLSDNSFIFHANRHDIALYPSTDDEPATLCANILRQDEPHDGPFPMRVTHYNRLNMIAAIPELSLVLIASQVGRVALITITRPIYPSAQLLGNVTFRLDLVLPFSSEEGTRGTRPDDGLLGIAVAPMHADERTRDRKRFRLLLHYYDHSVVSYILSREEEIGDLLCV